MENERTRPWREFFSPMSWLFWGSHLVAVIGVMALGFSWSGLILALSLYAIRMFFITGVFHRYLSHRAYRTSRWFQFLLTFGGTTSAQKGALWWAANHRHHHKHSDEPNDIHSPKQQGLWWSHVGWIVAKDHDQTLWHKIPDLARFPELVWLNRFHLLPPIAMAVALYWISGMHGLIWGFFASTVLLWHGTFAINSLAHVIGRRRYPTSDTSKNSMLLALITLGEGWHNNHHHYQRAANQGFRWYEIDLTYYALRVLSWVGLVWDVHRAPAHVVAGRTRARSAAARSISAG